MAHPMYGIDALLKKYPLVAKAFDKLEGDIEAAFFGLGGEAAVIKAPKMVIDMVDQNIDGTDAEKQGLIIGCFYLLAPATLEADKGNLDAAYGTEAAAVIGRVLAHNKTVFTDANNPAPETIARAAMVLGVTATQLLFSTLSEGGAKIQLPPAAVAAMKAQMLAGEKPLLPNLNAPRLEALHKKVMQDLFALLEGTAPKSGKKPGGPQV